ncbi:MAG: DinB family protein [Bacteroidetes bacterium]|nr:DinB family protein [Bacteroidota bacterium]
MELYSLFKKELKEELISTEKMLSRVPADKMEWRPHEKSMTMKSLAGHIAELPGWISMALTTDGLDFAKGDYKPAVVNEPGDLLKILHEAADNAFKQLTPENEHKMHEAWILRNGDIVLKNYTRAETIRMALNQIVHHRAQLGVYLRLLNIPIPGSYGPSADDHDFK